MSGFNLSPGITPLLTDLFVVQVPIALALGYAIRTGRGFQFAFGLYAVVLGAIKLYTDYTDLLDLPVAFGGIVGGLGVLAISVRPAWRLGRSIRRVGAVLLVLIGAIKVARDFYDPFDVLLADLILGSGLFLWVHGSEHAAESSSPVGMSTAGEPP